MFVCIDCGEVFEESKHWQERHGLDTPPYEEWTGCPQCGGSYTIAYRCDDCGEWITDEYIKIDDARYCSNCYQITDLGDEE